VFLWASSSQAQRGDSQFIIGLEGEPERLDPLTIKNPQTFILSWQIYEGLLGLDPQGRIAPMLAERWETPDYQTWTFHLRRNVTFHRSELFPSPDKTRPVTAHDVLWTYTAYCSPAAYSSFLLTDAVKGCAEYNAKQVTSVEGLRALDDYTFQIVLLKPEPFFLNRLTTAWIAVFPKEAYQEPFKEQWGLQSAVGTGPYQLQSKSDSEVVLIRNERYWDKNRLPSVERLVYRILKNDQVRFAALTNQRIDMMVVPTQLFPTIFGPQGDLRGTYKAKFQVTALTTFNTHMIGINLKQLSDVHLRRAMYYGTDRGEIVQKLLYGYADITGGTLPPGMNGYVPPFDQKSLYDPQRAREELKRSQYDRRELELLVHELANSEQIGQIFQRQMKEIGVNIKLTKLDFNSVIGRMVKGEAELFSMFLEYVFSSPESILVNLFTSPKIPVPNFWHYSNPQIDAEIESLRIITSSEKSVKKSAEIEGKIMEEAPTIFLYRQKYVVMYSRKFKDLVVNGHGHYRLQDLQIAQ
jgi:ABC-type transport system substrate-binding protein